MKLVKFIFLILSIFSIINCFNYYRFNDEKNTDTLKISRNPSVTWTGIEYGVVWSEDFNKNDYNECFNLLFCRLNAEGSKLIEIKNLTQKSSNYDANDLDITFNGINYGIVWREKAESKIYYTLINSSGQSLLTPVVLAEGNTPYHPNLINEGSYFGFSYTPYAMIDNINYKNIDVYGNQIGNINILNTGHSLGIFNNQRIYSINWTGEIFYMIYCTENQSICFQSFNSSFVSLGCEVIISSYPITGTYGIDMIYTGTDFGLVWSQSYNSQTAIYYTRLNSSGTKLLQEKVILSPIWLSYSPSITFNGTGFAVVWENDEKIFFTVINNDSASSIIKISN